MTFQIPFAIKARPSARLDQTVKHALVVNQQFSKLHRSMPQRGI
jgi:hypothetical protein